MKAARRRVRIRNPFGLHLQMASKLARLACSSNYSISIHNSKGSADPVSIFELMILGVTAGDWVTVSVFEPNAGEVLDGVCDFLATYEDEHTVHLDIDASDVDSFAA